MKTQNYSTLCQRVQSRDLSKGNPENQKLKQKIKTWKSKSENQKSKIKTQNSKLKIKPENPKLQHSVPKGPKSGLVQEKTWNLKIKTKNHLTLCQRALWDLSKGKIKTLNSKLKQKIKTQNSNVKLENQKLPHSVPKGPLGLVQGKRLLLFVRRVGVSI
jgi:hypothetical protein